LAFFDIISRWLALKNLFGLLTHSWPFFAKIGSFEVKYSIIIIFLPAAHLQNVCEKCYIRRPHSDISNI